MQYDLAVAYRIYPKVSKTPPVFATDKLQLSNLCLRSFRRGIAGLKVKLFALLDGCPSQYEEIFRQSFGQRDLQLINLPSVGNRPTFGHQINLLTAQSDAELVYFAEDDYFYRPGAIAEMSSFLRANADADFVTPYDHPDGYQLPLHPRSQEIRPWGTRHWRTAASTCLTFLTSKSTLQRTASVFRTYQRTNLDVSLWMALTKQTVLNPFALFRCLRRSVRFAGYIAQSWRYKPLQILLGKKWKLWCPLPSLATHMEVPFLAPCVNWMEAFERYD